MKKYFHIGIRFFLWFVYSYLIIIIFYRFFPDKTGFDLNDAILIFILISSIFFYRFINEKRNQKVYFDYLKKMKENGKISEEKYQNAIATDIIVRNIFKRGIYEGTFISEEGDEYVGKFKNGKYRGQGTYTFSNGDKTIGEFKDNKPHGQVTFISSKGEKYVGEYKDNKFNGQGTYTYTDGTGYVGEFIDNNKNGYGKETFPNGSKYIGDYKDNKPHGQGTMTHSDGKIEKGIWENGKLIKNEESN